MIMCCLVRNIAHLREQWQMSMGHWWNNNYQGKIVRTWKQELLSLRFVHREPHIVSPCNEHGTLQGEYKAKPRYGPIYVNIS
jgi:hypothetical protein